MLTQHFGSDRISVLRAVLLMCWFLSELSARAGRVLNGT